MKKRILSLALVVIMIAIMLSSFTMAYFTDTTDEVENVFTVGSVKIELLESQLHRDNDDATDEQIIADAANYQEYLAEAGKNMVPGRWVKKAPYVYNTGDNAAYVRIKMTVNKNVFKNMLQTMLYTTAFNNGKMVMDNGVEDGDNITYTFTYTEALEPGEVTYYAPFWRFKIMDKLDQDDVAKLEEAAKTITVSAEAIQAEGFADYEAAFAAFDAQNG